MGCIFRVDFCVKKIVGFDENADCKSVDDKKKFEVYIFY